MNDRTRGRNEPPGLEIPDAGRPWSFDGDPDLFRLVSEAYRIRLAALFDPLLAVHTSRLEPLPHQITAVYETLLSRQPLRFVLADDPGAGKTVMAGLLIKELRVRGDVQRCLIVCPGNLVEQWQDELARRFSLPFEIVPPDAARTGTWFTEHPFSICRLDTLSRNDALQATLETTDWDLIVCDEAHKMSASFWGGEIRRTGRYRLGQRLSALTRHFLLLTATPHNGREEDFQLFLALLDADRFEGRFRAGVHSVDASDLMRRMVKEDLLTFDGRPLFPERRAYTASYTLSEDEADLYRRVTEYVRGEFDRAARLASDGRKRTVGFALTVLQRRLASSPEAIYQSLRRRTARLEERCREAERLRRGGDALGWGNDVPPLSEADLADLDDAPDEELADAEARVADRASAARTVAELRAEIASLRRLTAAALRVRTARPDRKWDELSRLLQTPMFAAGRPRKLIVFTEHRDTLAYLQERIGTLLGRPDAVAVIHGGLGRDARREVQARFTQDKDVTVLLATDAAGEGINLQRAHLMVNYDLPWNPNRLEQRFGRIHRIGQTEVCHCWNLVASGTREGAVYRRLLEKLDEARKALGGKVFDVLGRLTFDDEPLRHLLIEAVRYGDRPAMRARLDRSMARALDRDALHALIDTHALVPAGLDAARVREIRDRMDRAAARRLQPHFVAAFFIEAFRRLGGSLREREPKRYEATHVPTVLRGSRGPGTHDPVLPRYERLTFDKARVDVPGTPVAEFVCPGHPLLDATLALVLERHAALLERGTILIDDADPGGEARTLVALEHTIREAGTDRGGTRRPVSRQVRFVEIRRNGAAAEAGPAPYLDYRPPTASERRRLSAVLPDVPRADVEAAALHHAAERLVPAHLHDVRTRRARHVDKTEAAVRERLTVEISHWDHRAEQLKQREAAGRPNAKTTSVRARQRADELAARLVRRMDELARERRVASLPPTLVGGALIVPAGLLAERAGRPEPAASVRDTRRVEMVAMRAVLEHERARGFEPRDVSADKCGYDVESRDPARQRLRFIEVKGRVTGADTVTCTRNEILTALNEPDRFLLALVEVEGDAARTITYVPRPFGREPDFGAASVTYKLADLLARPGRVVHRPME